MLESINRFFRQRLDAPAGGAEDPDLRLQVATCALLLEAAHADDEFTDEERQTVTGLIRQQFHLTSEDADDLIRLADEERRQSTDLYQFTRLIGDRFSRPEKLVVLEQLWRVVYSDGRLEAHEDALMHKMSNLLGLKHRELIALKLRVKGE